jgi:uncharacterized membrane protein YiaA
MTSSTFTGLAAVFFGAAVILLLIGLYHGSSVTALGVAGLLFAAAVACWARAAQVQARERP